MDTATDTAKTSATSLIITRAEGPINLCISRIFDTDDSGTCWTKAAAFLRSQCHTFPASGGYDKHDLCVYFADGETYKGRLDCKANGEDCDPADHVRVFVEFVAGLRCPAHWSAEKYMAHIKEDLADAAEAMAFLATYQIG